LRRVTTPAVSLRGLTKTYGDFTALKPITLDIPPGVVFALLGPNGAGKTTLISLVTGLLRPTAGTAQVLGHDVVKDYRLTRRQVGLVPQELNFDPFFNVEDTLRIQAGYFGVTLTEARLTELLAALDLTEKRRANTRSLSGGMKRRLLIGKALVHEPRVLFLDEPTAGVDVELRQGLWRYVRALQKTGVTVVLTTHYLEEAEELADQVAVINHGTLQIVEEKQKLLQTHARQSLRVSLATPIASVPASLAPLSPELVEDGRALIFSTAWGQSFGPALAAVATAGLPVRDVETRRMSLEDVFVSLLRTGTVGAAAPPQVTSEVQP
jgi:ABC-2 type transport system ATP-binding protein